MDGPRRRILVVDDNVEWLETVTDLLMGLNHEVVTCTTGLGALLEIGFRMPSLVLLDLSLEDASGFDVYRALRQDTRTAFLPVVFASGVFLDQDLLQARVGDKNARLILKPVTLETLAAEIDNALSGTPLPH